MKTLFCSYSPTVGWRVHLCCDYIDSAIRIAEHNGIKCLVVPYVEHVRNGRFCNPAKLTLTYFKYERAISMLKLPSDLKPGDLDKHIVSINSADPDFYAFGTNTRIVCGDDRTAADKVFEDSGAATKEQADLFWSGYYYGIETLLTFSQVTEA